MTWRLVSAKPYMKQCWLIIIWTVRNKLIWNPNRYRKLFFRENVLSTPTNFTDDSTVILFIIFKNLRDWVVIIPHNQWYEGIYSKFGYWGGKQKDPPNQHFLLLSGAPHFFDRNKILSGGDLSHCADFFDRNKILSGGDLSHYQVRHCIRVFFYFVWFVFIHHNFQFYFELCTYCNILDIYLS